MFGLKIVKAQKLNDLEWSLQQAYKLIDEKTSKIDDLYVEIESLKKKLADYETPKKEKVVELLTDVAETPLIEEPKSEGKPKRVVKKTGGTKTRRKVVYKSDEK